ncbi:MAG: hypothetical protein WBW88_04085, partial [Rhodothermales bacterium]
NPDAQCRDTDEVGGDDDQIRKADSEQVLWIWGTGDCTKLRLGPRGKGYANFRIISAGDMSRKERRRLPEHILAEVKLLGH